MAFAANNQYPNLIDWAKSTDPDGNIADIAELLAQTNTVIKDIIWQEGNLPLGHRTSIRVGLPQPSYRQNNQGTPSTKPLQAQFDVAIGELVDYSMVDKSEATLNGNVDRFRLSQDNAHIMGFGQKVASDIFYANESTTPNSFTGFFPYYNTVSTANAQSAVNVIDAGGTGSSNCSILMTGWGDETNFMVFPKGSTAGLLYENKGDVTPLYDTNGYRYEGYTSYFCWKLGLCPKNWEYNVRIANIDTTTAGLAGSAPPDLFVLLSEAVNKFPTFTMRGSGITEVDNPTDPSPGILPAIYCNRIVRTAMDVQAIRDKNVLISMNDFAGQAVMSFREIPIRVNDALIATESRVV